MDEKLRQRYDEVVEQRNELVLEWNALAVDEELTPGQLERKHNLSRGIEKLEAEIAGIRDEQRAQLKDFAERHPQNQFSGEEHGDRPTQRGGGGRADPVRSAALRAIDGERFADDDAKQTATRLVEGDSSGFAARWATAAADPSYATAFAKLVRDPERGHLEWTGDEQRAFARAQHEQRAMAIGSGSTGGHMVPFVLDPAIQLTNAGAINPIRDIARTVTTVGSQWAGVTSAGVSAEWKAEGAEAADASPTLSQPDIDVHLADIFVPFSIEAEQDAESLLQELRRIMADEKAVHEAAAFTTGDGSGKPQGIVTALTASETVDTAATTTFASGDVYALLEDLPARFRPNARWLAALPVINELDQFETGNGAKLFPRVGDANPTLLRRPLHETSDMDAGTSSAGDHILLAGDFGHYVIVDRVGATMELVPHLVGSNQRPTGERGAFFYWRVGGDVTVANAFRRLEVAA